MRVKYLKIYLYKISIVDRRSGVKKNYKIFLECVHIWQMCRECACLHKARELHSAHVGYNSEICLRVVRASSMYEYVLRVNCASAVLSLCSASVCYRPLSSKSILELRGVNRITRVRYASIRGTFARCVHTLRVFLRQLGTSYKLPFEVVISNEIRSEH